MGKINQKENTWNNHEEGFDGTEMTDRKDIIAEQHRFYEDLYSSRLNNTKIMTNTF